jgi:hypothetical protein
MKENKMGGIYKMQHTFTRKRDTKTLMTERQETYLGRVVSRRIKRILIYENKKKIDL